MEQPVVPKAHLRAQSSIRSFFQPRQPSYAPPPSSANSNVDVGGRISAMPSSPLRRSVSPVVLPEPAASPLMPRSGTASPQQASISPIREKHIQQLKRINSLLLPINYPDSFYQKIFDPQNSPNFSRVVLFHEPLTLKLVFSPSPEPKVVGGIVCRLEKDETTKTSSIYIQSLALLSPYRSHGLATKVLNNIIQGAINTPQIGYPITSLYAHVWTENLEGLDWYTARGFTREEPVIKDYYRRLQPPNAWIMRRSLVTHDHLRHFLKPNGRVSSHTNSVTSPTALLTPNQNPASSHSPSRPSPRLTASYQNNGPGHEWNDLPDDILGGKSKPQTPEPSVRAASRTHLMPSTSQSAAGSAASSRSSSRSAAKKKRQYPTAALDGSAKEEDNH